jgi:tol-pal system protein YbgF
VIRERARSITQDEAAGPTQSSAETTRANWRRRAVPLLVAGTIVSLAGGAVALADPLRREQVAQLLNRPPGVVPEGEDGQSLPDPGEASLLVRIDRLENQIRALTGQIEQMQFQQRRLEEGLRKVQQDTELRPQDPQSHGAVASPIRPPPQMPPPSAPVTGATGVTAPFAGPVAVPARRGDAFDPNAEPDAPGAPRPLGSLDAPPSPPGPPGARGIDLEGSDPNAPMDLRHPARPRTAAIANPVQSDAIAATPRAAGAGLASVAPPAAARDEFEIGRGLYRQGQYEAAQNAFANFLQKSPKDARVPDATFWLGETFSQRGRHREAAEQYLKLSTDYPKSPRAPEGLLRLGMSLSALGAKEQACATFQELGRKYPSASAGVKSGVDREFKRAKC